MPVRLSQRIPPAPYQGAAEDALRRSYLHQFRSLRRWMRSREGRTNLVNAFERGNLIPYVDQLIDDVTVNYQHAVHAVYHPISLDRLVVAEDTRDTREPLAKATVGPHSIPSQRRARPRRTPLRLQPTHRASANSRNHWATAYSRQYSGRLVTHANLTTKHAVRDIVHLGVSRGWRVEHIAARVADVVGLFPRWARAVTNLHERLLNAGVNPRMAERRAANYADSLLDKRSMMIARTEVMRASNLGRLADWLDKGDKGLLDVERSIKSWSAAPGACPECDDLDGVEVEGVVGTFDTSVGPVIAPPLHPHCFPAGTVVSGPAVVAATVRSYEGELLTLFFASGEQLAVTPNHPVLTPEGWIAAGSLYEGSQVLRSTWTEREVEAVDPNDCQVPVVIEEVFAAVEEASKVAACRVPATAEHFHGDGFGSDVDVVYANSVLVDDRPDVSAQRTPEQLFSDGGGRGGGTRGRDSFSMFTRRRSAAHGIMSRLRVRSILFGRALGHHETVGVDDTAWRDIVLRENAADDVTTDPVLARQSVLARPSPVTLDQVIDIVRYPFSGHVYNLQTSEGWYRANGVVVSNCRCTTTLQVVAQTQQGEVTSPDMSTDMNIADEEVDAGL